MPARCPRAMIDDDPTDEELIGRARRGEEPAFGLLMRRHSGSIRRLVAHYFRNRSVVDDMAQETFVKAYYGLNSFHNDSPFVYWLRKIAVRLCLDEMRRRKPETVDREDSIDAITENSASGNSERRIEARLLLDKVLSGLSPLDRMIVVLLYGEGYDSKEISGLTGLSLANVKVRAFRIRRRLRMLYAGDSI